MQTVGLDARYTTHSRRHAEATHRSLASDGDRDVVQERLGHANISKRTICARITKEDKLRAANALAKAYRDSGTRKEPAKGA